jgi:hypothetical protein
MDTPPAISSPPPPALPPGKRPFAFRAAKASLFSPFLAFGLNVIVVIGDEMINGFAPSAVALKITLMILIPIFALFTVSGFILGIISLFGISRYGKKGILGYAIIGIVLNGAPWLWIIISSFVITFKHPPTFP